VGRDARVTTGQDLIDFHAERPYKYVNGKTYCRCGRRWPCAIRARLEAVQALYKEKIG
jgi:hypothetical protein